MGTVVRFPVRRHARASSVAAKPIAESASSVMPGTPRSAAKRDKGAKCREGTPLDRQQLTAAFFSESAEATAVVPPRASMTESGVNMEATLVCTMQTCQEFASGQTTFGTGYGAIGSMPDPRPVIAARLEALRKELKIATEQEFAIAIGLDKSTYSSIKNSKRNLSFETACIIKEKFRISIDWLFYGDFQQSADRIMTKIGSGPAVEIIHPTRRRKA